jgi:hypothetical protein
MITVPFPVDISGKREKEISAWVGQHARFGPTSLLIEFDDEELALYFRLKFGL